MRGGRRRIEQAGGKMISVPQLFCELQRYADDGHPQMAVFDHESLAAAAAGNPYSARMQQAIADSRKAA